MFSLETVYNLFFGSISPDFLKTDSNCISPKIEEIRLLSTNEQKQLGHLKPRTFFIDIPIKDYNDSVGGNIPGEKGLLPAPLIDATQKIWTDSSLVNKFTQRSESYKAKKQRSACKQALITTPSLLDDISKRCEKIYGTFLKNYDTQLLLTAYEQDLKDDFFKDTCSEAQQIKELLLIYMKDNPYRTIAVMILHGLILNDSYLIFKPIMEHYFDLVPDKSKKKQALEILSYKEIADKGYLSAQGVATLLVANDWKLYTEENNIVTPITHEIEKDPSYWAIHMLQHPDHWEMLIQHTDGKMTIHGNYSFVGISDKIIERLKKEGKYHADYFHVSKCRSLTLGTKNLFLLNLSVNMGYQEYYDSLWEHFFDKLADAALNEDCYIEKVYTVLFRYDHIGLYRELGFRPIPGVTFQNGLKLYCLDLTKPFKPALISRAPRLYEILTQEIAESELCFRNIIPTEVNDRMLKEISRMIWLTDHYIYEEAIMPLTDAVNVLPLLFKDGSDSMFSLKNLFGCFHNNKLIGIILYATDFKWNPSLLRRAMEVCDVPINEDALRRVTKEYFNKYSQESPGTTVILNFYVDPIFRKTPNVQRDFLKAFGTQHPEELVLYSLGETPSLTETYVSAGFPLELVQPCYGFSLNQPTLRCFKLTRPTVKTT